MGLFGGRRRGPVNRHAVAGFSQSEMMLSAPAQAEAMTSKQLINLEFWMVQKFQERTAPTAREIWLRRVRLGYALPATEMPQNVRFWLNAYPALSASVLQLGGERIPEADLALVCREAARECVDRSNDAQMGAMKDLGRQP